MTGVFYCKEKNFVIGFYRGLSPRFFLEKMENKERMLL